MMRFLAAPLILSILATPTFAGEPTPQEIFDQRILPIFRSENPSSCVQCHLSSVDLKDYILPSLEATFVSLRDQGLINLDAPSKSKILTLIQMGDKDPDEGARLIHADMRKAEIDAFSAWVTACCRDSDVRELPEATTLARPAKADAVIRHARKSRVVDSFVRNIWSQRLRCFPCHTPNEIDPDNPKHKAALKTQKQLAEKYDDVMLERLGFFRETPEATLEYLIQASIDTPDGQLPLINLAEAANSLLVLKPTSKLPAKRDDGTFAAASSVDPVTHGGGLKMHANDHSYKAFVAWIQDYAKVVSGEYQTIDDLPMDNWYPSQLILRMKSLPEDWRIGMPVQMFVHGWDESKDDWSELPIAFTQGSVTPRRFVNGALFLLSSGDEEQIAAWRENTVMKKGNRYLVRTYVDQRGTLAENPAGMLTKTDFGGEVEISKARWKPGFKFATVVDGQQLQQP